MAEENKKQQLSISSASNDERKKKKSSKFLALLDSFSRNKKGSSSKPVHVAYHLFLYREELRRPDHRSLKLSKAKFQLTTDLVVISWNDIDSYNNDERENLVQNILYKRKLKNTIDKINKSDSLKK